jgi:hypothetical protein
MFFPDALAFEPVYRVTGSATNEAERNAAVNLSQPSERSSTREVRVRLFAGRARTIGDCSPLFNTTSWGRILRYAVSQSDAWLI